MHLNNGKLGLWNIFQKLIAGVAGNTRQIWISLETMLHSNPEGSVYDHVTTRSLVIQVITPYMIVHSQQYDSHIVAEVACCICIRYEDLLFQARGQTVSDFFPNCSERRKT